MKPFLILETGTPVDSLRRHGGFPDWIRVASGLHQREVQVCRVASGEALPDREKYAGVLVTGSAAMVTERHPWSESTAAWLREAAHAGAPLFGVCYGHQLLAHALGGEVGDNPAGREMGTITVTLRPEARQDALFAPLPDTFTAQATHLQTVLAPPPGAKVLAASDKDACQAFQWGARTWGVQFHPEFSTEHMRGYVLARKVALMREGADPKALRNGVAATPHARGLLRKFVHHARQGA
ncbi:MAG TPA: glutamine amidotransferase [Planctomycetota bacterium]|nr:glutamine amidotransferase [Planctomycetota bacterium]